MLEKLKVLKTLTTAEVLSLINGSTVGVFTTAIENTDPYYTQAHGLALEYYLSHSAEKEVSATYYNIKAQLEAMPTVQKTVNELLGDICRNKFQHKWTSIYQALVLGDYDPLEDYTHFEHKTANNTDTVTYGKSTTRTDEYNSSVEDNGNTGVNKTVTTNRSDEMTASVEDNGKTGTNKTVTTNRSDETTASVEDNGKTGVNKTVTKEHSDKNTSSVEDNGNTGTNRTVTTDSSDEDNTFGFNSATPVGADNSSSATTETTVAPSDTNTSHNLKETTESSSSTDTETTVAPSESNTTYNKQDKTENVTGLTTEKTVGSADENTTYNKKDTSENSSANTTETTLAPSETNTTHNKQDKTGNDTRTETDGGSDKTDYDVNETIDKHGRNVGAQELLQKELDLRSQNIFYNIVFKDVDSVVASRIY